MKKDDDIESEADKYEQESFTDSDGFMSIPEGMEEELPIQNNRRKNRLKMFPLKKVGTRVGTRVGTQETQQPRGF